MSSRRSARPPTGSWRTLTGGDIFTADPVTGVAKAVVTGSDDVRPVFSRDGTHFVFERMQYGSGRLIVARSDGTGPVIVTPESVTGLQASWDAAPAQYAFSPDGTEIALSSTVEAGGKLWIAQADGSGMRQVALPISVGDVSYQPDGTELVLTGATNGDPAGVYAVDTKTGATRTIVVPASDRDVGYLRLSPDGSRLAYTSSARDGSPSSYRVHVIGMNGANDVTLPLPPRAVFQDAPAWSNDGTRLAITRGYAEHNEEMAVAVVPADGLGTGVESAHGLTGCCDTILQWSPDDTSVLIMPEAQEDLVAKQHLLLDPLTGQTTPAPWAASDPPAWQRTVR